MSTSSGRGDELPGRGPAAASPGEIRTNRPDSDRSIGQVFGDVSRDLSTLVRQEIALAKAEVGQAGSRAGKGIAMLAGAGIAVVLLLVFLSVSGWWALGLIIGNALSALAVAAAWLIIGCILGLIGRAELRRIRGLPETVDTIKRVPNALKGNEEENR